MSDEQNSNNKIRSTITGNVSGQVAVGNNIAQQRTTAPPPEITAAEREALRQLLNELRTQIVTQAPNEKRAAALERAAELEEAIANNKKPDLTTMEYVKNWFVKYVPTLAQAVGSIIIHPVVGKLVAVAGDALSEEFRNRFGASK